MASAKERVLLLALDGSQASAHAFDTYVDILRRDGDRVVLFTCKELGEVLNTFWKETAFEYNPELLRDRMGKEEEEVKTMMKPFADRLEQLEVNHKPKFVVGKNAGHLIIETAEKENARLIVMGSNGHGKLRRMLMGSCSEFVVKHSDIPVVVCRKP